MEAPDPCSGNSAASPNSSWIRCPPEYHATLVAAFALLELARFFNTEVDERPKIGVDARFLTLELGLVFDFPVLAYLGLVPSAFALVAVAELLPPGIDVSLGSGH